MAMLGSPSDSHYRSANKEPEWSSICNNVFDQYLETDDLFGFEAGNHERSSSDESDKLFDFSTESEQSHQTSGTSPMPTWEREVNQTAGAIIAKQPKAQEPVDFWAKTLRALEQNAAQSEKKQQRQQQRTLRTAKSHGDFLSLGGFPSPPAIPSSPNDQSASRHRRRSRGTANGRMASQARSVSRGRPTGVMKSAQIATVNPSATVRNFSASPPKMMNPSRYRAGFREIWTERTAASPKKYQLRVPSYDLPESSPPSMDWPQDDDFAVFGSPVAAYPASSKYDDDLSPLTKNFQQAHIHTPIASPSISHVAYLSNHHFEPLPPVSSYAAQSVPLNDTAPLFPERTSSLIPGTLQTFDFGFPTSADVGAWSAAPSTDASSAHQNAANYLMNDPFAIADVGVLPSIESSHGLPSAGLGIFCDRTLVSDSLTMPHTGTLSATTFHQDFQGTPYYTAPPAPMTMPNRPHRRSQSRLRSDSPSPPVSESRARRAISRSRRVSRHRRAKSTNSTPRRSEGPEPGGFVNFTPHDSNKILSGVAPSGSSKTKARREKEAADKRRRFSQAAVRAVVEAGGDLDALSKVGLLV